MFLIPIIAIVSMHLLYQKINQKRFGAVSFLISIYLVMCASSVVLYVFYDYDTLYLVEPEPMLYLSLCLIISFWGFFPYKDQYIRLLIIENRILISALEKFQIVTASIAIIFFLPFAITGLTGNVSDNRTNIQFEGTGMMAYGLLNTLCSLAGNLFVLSILLSFVNFATIGRGGSRLKGKLLLVLSSVYIIYVLAYVGRDGFVYWLLSIIFIFLMTKDFIPRKEQQQIKIITQTMISAALIPFVAITLARFAVEVGSAYTGTSNSALLSIFDYSGSQFFDFSDQYRAEAPPMLGLVNFGQTLELVSHIAGSRFQALDRFDWFEYYTKAGAVPWRFSTFIGSWIQDFERMGTFLAVLILALLTRLSLHKVAATGELRFSNVLYFVLLSQIPLFGIFYYRQFSSVYAQIAIVLIALAFTLSGNKKHLLKIEKQTKQ